MFASSIEKAQNQQQAFTLATQGLLGEANHNRQQQQARQFLPWPQKDDDNLHRRPRLYSQISKAEHGTPSKEAVNCLTVQEKTLRHAHQRLQSQKGIRAGRRAGRGAAELARGSGNVV